MSTFVDMLCDMLPLHSAIQKSDNPLRRVLDKSVGEWMDGFEQPYDELFLSTASGGWLDAHGRDYGVPRKLDETDEDYRERIVYEKLDHLTVGLLYTVYGLDLFVFVEDFDPLENTLTSDNPHISNKYMSIADEDLQSILNGKFVLEGEVTWI